jgi:hypothetical protein
MMAVGDQFPLLHKYNDGRGGSISPAAQRLFAIDYPPSWVIFSFLLYQQL